MRKLRNNYPAENSYETESDSETDSSNQQGGLDGSNFGVGGSDSNRNLL